MISSGAYAGVRAVDIRFQSRDQIWNPDEKLHTGLVMLVFIKQELSFQIILLALHGVIYIFVVLTFCINHGGLDVASWRVDHRWWQMRAL